MKHHASTRKTARNADRDYDQSISADSNGVAIAPPVYGIDVVDYQSVGMESEYEQAEQSLESTTWPTQSHPIQRQSAATETNSGSLGPNRPNKTGLPDKLKAGIETLSGMTMDDVRVHYNSSKPTQLQALAYTQGTDIHVGPGQERHLPHEAWHVVQQKDGRVKPTTRTNINDDARLENEADMMSHKARQVGPTLIARELTHVKQQNVLRDSGNRDHIIQRMSMAAVNEDTLYDMLRNDEKGDETIRMLTRVNKYYCTSVDYFNSPEPGTLGITFPHEKPPMVVVNVTPHRDTEHLAHTIYHELRHAFDQTYPVYLNTELAKRDDLKNEAKTWYREIEYSIRHRGQEFNNNLGEGFIEGSGTPQDPYRPKPFDFFERYVNQNYGPGYLNQNRQQRFTPGNYTFGNKRAFATPTSPEWRSRAQDVEWTSLVEASLARLSTGN